MASVYRVLAANHIAGSIKPFGEVYLIMHEMSIAMNIIEIVCAAAENNEAEHISCIEIEIGSLAGVMAESLKFCFDAASRHTLAEGAQLKIIPLPARGKCSVCETEIEIESFATPCPDCNGFLYQISSGTDIKILSLIIDE